MGGRGSNSASGKINVAVQSFVNNMQTRASQYLVARSPLQRSVGEVAQAASNLASSGRFNAAITDNDITIVARNVTPPLYGHFGIKTLGDIRNMLTDGAEQNPGYSESEWLSRKSDVKSAIGRLEAKGYSVEEVAAMLIYEPEFRRLAGM